MNRLFSILVVLLVVTFNLSADANDWEKNPLLKSIPPEELRKIRGLFQMVRDEGCDINLCFALQGDDFISDAQFEAQKNFVDLMIAIITTDQTGNYCAVQYGFHTTPISELIGNKDDFLEALHGAKKVGGTATNIAGALAYTGFQLRAQFDDVNEVILLGDGLTTRGFDPKFIIDSLREDGTDISAVAVGDSQDLSSLIEIVGGEKYKHRVVQINRFFDLAEIVASLVYNICGFFP